MKDFTKKGTKLPVIPVGTKFRTVSCDKSSFLLSQEILEGYSFGMHNEKWLKVDQVEYKGFNHYLIKLSTIERLAKEQGMYNTNNETMNPKVKLQENGTVTVTDTETTTTLSKVTVDEICRLVKDKDKQPIKPVITYGGWYQNKSNPKIVVFYEKDDAVFGGVGYGFDDCGGFTHANNWSLKSFKEDWQPATPETVQQYLRKEAVKRGYKKGVKVSRPYTFINKGIAIIESDEFKPLGNINIGFQMGGISIFEKGVWATIIQPEIITRAEAEKRYDVKITD